MSQVKTSDVTKFISDMITTSMIYEIDDEGYVIKKNNGERVTKSEAGRNVNLLVYQENVTDREVLVINPLSEGQGVTPDSLWLTNIMRVALLGRVFVAFRTILAAALEEKKTKSDKDKHLNIEILKHASKIIDMVDAKMLSELDKLSDDKENNEFLTIYYQRKQLRSTLRTALFEVPTPRIPGEDKVLTWKEKHGSLRDKTWKCFETLMLSMLGISEKEDIERFTRKATVISCSRLSSFLNVVLAVYQEINPVLAAIDNELAIDLTQFVFHLNRLEAYSDNAKFWRQPQKIVEMPTSTVIPTGIPIGMPAPSYPAVNSPPTQVDLIPGPVNVDGSPSAPIQVLRPQYQPQQTGYYGQPSGIPQMPMPGMLPVGQQPQQNYLGNMTPNYNQPVPNYNQPLPSNIPFAGPYISAPIQGQPQYGGGYVQYPGGPVINRYA